MARSVQPHPSRRKTRRHATSDRHGKPTRLKPRTCRVPGCIGMADVGPLCCAHRRVLTDGRQPPTHHRTLITSMPLFEADERREPKTRIHRAPTDRRCRQSVAVQRQLWDEGASNAEPDRSHPSLKAIRFTAPSEQPLLDEIDRQELTERLIAILNELRSRTSSSTNNDGGQGDG